MGLFSPNISKLEKENNISGLLNCLEHKNANVRYSAFVALAHNRDLGLEVIAKLKSMVHDPDPWVRTLAVLKFAELGDKTVSDSLLDIMEEGSLSERIELLNIIAGRGPSDDTAVLGAIVVVRENNDPNLKCNRQKGDSFKKPF